MPKGAGGRPGGGSGVTDGAGRAGCRRAPVPRRDHAASPAPPSTFLQRSRPPFMSSPPGPWSRLLPPPNRVPCSPLLAASHLHAQLWRHLPGDFPDLRHPPTRPPGHTHTRSYLRTCLLPSLRWVSLQHVILEAGPRGLIHQCVPEPSLVWAHLVPDKAWVETGVSRGAGQDGAQELCACKIGRASCRERVSSPV